MVEVSGRITQVVNVDGKYPQLRIWIEGQDDPFCSTGSSRSLLPADIVDRLQRAETAVIAVEKEEVDSSRHNYAQGSSFREIRMLSPDGAPAVTLEASSKQMSERHEFARLVAPAIAVFSAAWPASPAAAEAPMHTWFAAVGVADGVARDRTRECPEDGRSDIVVGMPVDTRTAPRRPLHFKCLGCLKAELDRIEAANRAGTLATTGNWTPAENLDHCSVTFEAGLDGAARRAPFLARLFGRLLKGRVTADRPGAMRPGFRFPRDAADLAPRPGVTFEQGMDRLRRAIARLDAGERMAKPSPWLGELSHEQWVRLNLNHSQMHLGFLTYPGAPQA